MAPKISIAMATYNGAAYLQQQLDSFLQQTRLPDELVVCDDGSTDATITILQRFRAMAPFTVHIHQNAVNLGYMRNFEQVLSLCTHELVFLSDQDDVWWPQKLAVMTELMDQAPTTQVLLADLQLTDAALNPTGRTQMQNVRALGNRDDALVFGCGTLVRRGWLAVALPVPTHLAAHDNWLHRLAVALNVRALHEQPLQFYRRHDSNASQWLASSLGRLTPLDALRAHGFQDATAGWAMECARVQATRERLDDSAGLLDQLGLLDRLPAARAQLLAHEQALYRRIACMTLPRSRRWFAVLNHWLLGDYRQFAGGLSALKDVVRP